MAAHYKFMCGCECCISDKNIHSSLLSWRDLYFFLKSKIKAKILKIEGLVKNKIAYMTHIKIQSFQMGVIFIPKHLILKGGKSLHIHSHIMHYHTGNLYCNFVLNVHVVIFLTKKQMINILTLVLQFYFTFIVLFGVVQHMEGFH